MMFIEIADLLTPAELGRLQELAGTSVFVDGRITNPHSKVKDNVQLNYNDQAYRESSRMVAEALQRNETFRNAAFPKVMAPPMLTKYGPGGRYGAHADAAFLPLGERRLRTDLSCTVFVSPPGAYEGGELSVELGTRQVEIKGEAGSAVVYPSNLLHQVRPVSSGERVVSLTFIESRIAEPEKRALLFELNEVAALEGLAMHAENFTRLQHVQMGLLRMWADPG